MDDPRSEEKDIDFEDALARLETIVRQLETENLGLDEALKRYEEGLSIAKTCLQVLEDAELRVQQLSLEP